MKKQSVFIFIILLAALSIGLWRENVASHGGVTSWGQSSKLAVGTALPLPQTVPAFALQDMHGQPFTEEELKQHWSIMVFGYTSCPESCPIILGAIKQIQHQLKSHANVETVFITIDPERDTPENLHAFFQTPAYEECQMNALTGSQQAIASLASQVGLHIEEATKKPTHIEHSGTLLLINPEGKIAALFTQVDQPTAIARDVKQMMHRYSRG